MPHIHYIDLLGVIAIAAALLVLLRPTLLTRSPITPYLTGAALLISGIAHLLGYAVFSVRFL